MRNETEDFEAAEQLWQHHLQLHSCIFSWPEACCPVCRVISSQAAVPLIYVPLEAVASKWYGESERNLAEIFRAAEQLGGAIIFLDEIDSLATQRRCLPIPSLKSKSPLLSDIKVESLSIALMCEASEQEVVPWRL